MNGEIELILTASKQVASKAVIAKIMPLGSARSCSSHSSQAMAVNYSLRTLILLTLLPYSSGEAGDLSLQLVSAPGAVCLDGSKPGYYWRAGRDPSRFLVAIQGGGWCSGETTEDTKVSCSERATGSLGSSKSWKPTLEEDAHGMTNSNCTINPAFCNHSVAYLQYCDGVSFSGDLSTPVSVPSGPVKTIYFRGSQIFTAIIDELSAKRGLLEATHVTLSGHSAGGLSTYLHADRFGERLRATTKAPSLVYGAVPDAGFFLDHRNIAGVPYFGTAMRSVFELANTTGNFNAACVAQHSDSPIDCLFPQNFISHIETDLHVTQSQVDSFHLEAILQLPCNPPKNNCNQTELSAFHQYQSTLRQLLAVPKVTNSSNPRAGIWSDACIAHTQGYYGHFMDNTEFEVPGSSGMTLAHSLHDWVTGRASKNVDTVQWGDNKPCEHFGCQGDACYHA